MAKTDKKSDDKGTHTVIAPFRDLNDYNKMYQPGDDVSHLDKDRLNELVSKNLVEVKGDDKS